MAVVGPSISLERYEVGEEAVLGIARWTEPKHFVRRGPGRPRRWGAAAIAQLIQAGVDKVARVNVCTWDDDRLWSHRQDGPLAVGRCDCGAAMVTGSSRSRVLRSGVRALGDALEAYDQGGRPLRLTDGGGGGFCRASASDRGVR